LRAALGKLVEAQKAEPLAQPPGIPIGEDDGLEAGLLQPISYDEDSK